MGKTDTKQYFEWIDLAKGIGIVFVVLGHAFRDEMRASSMVCEYIYRLIYLFHMPVFWTISGLTYSVSGSRHLSEKARYTAGRVRTLLIPLLVYSLVIYACFMTAYQIPAFSRILEGSSYAPCGVKDYLIRTFLAENPYAQHLWYIWMLFLFSLGIFWWQAISERLSVDWRILLPVSAALCWYLGYADFHEIHMPALGVYLTGYLIYFVCGAVLLSHRNILYGKAPLVRLCCLASWAILAVEAANAAFNLGIGDGGFFGWVRYTLVAAARFGVSVSFLRAAVRLEGHLSWLVYAGKKSYVIYLLHQPFCCAFVGTVLYNGLGWPMIAAYGICVVLSFAVPLLILRLANRIRIMGIVMKRLFNVY